MRMYNHSDNPDDFYEIDDKDLNDLDKIALNCGTDKGPSGHYYTKHYFQFLERLRNKKLNILELGVYRGSSLRMWKQFFPNTNIYGIDIDEKCKNFDEERIKIAIGDCCDPEFINRLFENYCSNFDIIIDDASHYPDQIIKSFNIFFEKLNFGGFYFIEDIFYCINDENWKEFFLYLQNSVCLSGLKSNKYGNWLASNRDRALQYMRNNPGLYSIDQIDSRIKNFSLYMNFLVIQK